MRQFTNDPRLVLKATAPKASRSLLYRQRLGLNSGEQAGRSVLALQAPAGYGKTSLLQQWRREALESGAIVAWLTLDEHDDDASFVRGLEVALSIGSGSGKFVRDAPGGSRGRDGELEALTVWLAEVASMAVDVELILDDAHSLPEQTVKGSLMYLLLNAPSNLRVMFAYRRSIALKFSDLIAMGRFLKLGAHDLSLTLDETMEWLGANPAAKFDKDASVRLYELTEGWPLGVQLAASSVMKRASPRDALAEFSARSGELQHYFMEVLVERLELDEVMFLTHIACLDRVHPELCEILTDNKGSRQMLAHLRDETPIFQDVVSGEWVRIHPIAHSFLSDRFERLPQDHRTLLHQRAAHWLVEQGMYEEAVPHARLAGDEQAAFDLIERCIHGVLNQGRMARVLEWLDQLPDSEVRRRPQIRISTGWALAMGDRHSEAALRVEALLVDPGASLAERCEAAEICATAGLFTDDFARIEQSIAPWRDSLAAQPLFQQIIGTNIVAVLDLFQGKPENANYHLQRMRNAARSPDLAYPLGWSDWIAGFAYLWEGHVVMAEEVLRSALARAESTSGRRSPIAVMLAATLAAVLWDRELHDEAAMLLADRLDVLERNAPPDAIIHGYLTAARLAAASGAQDQAHDLIEQLRAIGDARNLPRLCVASLAEEVRMFAFRRQESACLVRLAKLEQMVQDASSRWGILQPIVGAQLGMARVYAAITRYDWDSVLPLLADIDAQVRPARRVREALQVQLLRALASQQAGGDHVAMLAEARSLAETFGMARVLADTHPSLVELDVAAERAKPGEGSAGAGAARAGQHGAARARARVVESSLLTPKETEVLQLLAGNLSNKKIAAALGVGDQTVKWHLKNMFNKLQAGTRQHLLARARMLGILE